MTIEEKKKYLKQYAQASALLDALHTKHENALLEALSGGIDYSKDKIMISPTNDQFVNYVIKLEDIEVQIKEARKDAREKCDKVLNTINSMDNSLYKAILYRRYIFLQKWEEIALEMNYSDQRMFELHANALAEIHIPETFIQHQSESE